MEFSVISGSGRKYKIGCNDEMFSRIVDGILCNLHVKDEIHYLWIEKNPIYIGMPLVIFSAT